MIIPRTGKSAINPVFGGSGEAHAVPLHALGAMLYGIPAPLLRPLAAVPLRQNNFACVAMLASLRVEQGFRHHNRICRMLPNDWLHTLEKFHPDYLLIESAIYDAANAWPLACYKSGFAEMLKRMGEKARSLGIPAIFWFTLEADFLSFFQDAFPAFDIIACADLPSLEKMKKSGLPARYLPWAFAPEQFHPLHNHLGADWRPMLLFDGMARFMRFRRVRETLKQLQRLNPCVIDSGMIVPPYNLARFDDAELAATAHGYVSRNYIQELYKTATACLSLGDSPSQLRPAQICSNLEASACACPVLHCGPPGANGEFLKGFAKFHENTVELEADYRQLAADDLRRNSVGHLAWRNVHAHHTFRHRMAAFHKWLSLPVNPLVNEKASIITPSMRSGNFNAVYERYLAQTWPDKELVYVFNGRKQDLPLMPDSPDCKFLAVPDEFSTGMVMNAGIWQADGDILFRWDDDDLYGPEYVADRVIFMREFNIDLLGNANAFFTFGNDEAWLLGTKDGEKANTVYRMGNSAYSLMSYIGSSLAMRAKFARSLPFTEIAYAHEDVAHILKCIFLKPDAVYLKTDPFNFCVTRHDSHTWAAPPQELLPLAQHAPIALKKAFI